MFKVPQFRGPKYKKLNQYDDSSEGEDVIFEGESGGGHTRPQQQRLGGRGQDDFMFSSYDVEEDLRLPSEFSYKRKTRIPLNLRCSYRRFLLALMVGVVIAAALAAIILFFYLQAAAHTSTGASLTTASPTPQPTPHVGPRPRPTAPNEQTQGEPFVPSTTPGAQSARKPSDSPAPTSSVHDGSPTPTSSVHDGSPPLSSFHIAPGPSTSPALSAINYTLEFPQVLTEMTPEFYDLNRDGVLDILLSLGSMQAMAFDFWKCHESEVEEARQACMKYFGFYPCGCDVAALDGRTGHVLWRYHARMEVFSVTCPSDLTGDGALDCMLCGRGGTWEAVDGRTGKHIWSMDYSAVNALQNLYFPLNVGDLDKDGTVDFVNMNSGDPRYEPSNPNRPPGWLVVISGKTGQKLLEPLLVPDMRESYMSPVLYRDDNGNEFILIGTGGETVEGGLWAITLDSLRRKMEEYLQNQTVGHYTNDRVNDPHCHKDAATYIDSIVPTPQPEQYIIKENLSKADTADFYLLCPQTLFHPVPNVHDLCVYLVIASHEKGVILPPVIVDMNDDQVDDLVISLYCGHTLVLDGKSGSVIWDRYIPGTESYSIPAPLFYNSDRIPDLLVRVNKGTWDRGYQYSYTAVVDGADGSLLWAYNSSRVGFMSGTTLRAEGYGNDAILFTTVGHLDTLPLDEVRALERITQGKMTPHEWSPKRKGESERSRREAIEEGHFSVTEELEARLGLVKRQANTGGGVDASLIDSLQKLTDTDEVNGTTVQSTDDGASDSPNQGPANTTSTSTLSAEMDPSELESSSLPSLPLLPSVGAQVSSTATLKAGAMSDNLSSPALSSTETRTTAISACSAPVAPLPSSKEAIAVSQQSSTNVIETTVPPSVSSSSEGGPQTTPSSSSEGGSQKASSTVGATVDTPHSLSVGRPSDTTNAFTSSQGVVLPSSAVKSLFSSDTTSPVAASPSSTPVQAIGNSPPSSIAVMSSSSSGLSVKPTNQVASVNVDDIRSTSSSAASLTSQHPQATTEPEDHELSSNDAFFTSHIPSLEHGLKSIRFLKDKGWLDFTKNWQEVYSHDPVSEADKFMEEDCSVGGDKTAYVYFLTRAMIEKGHVHPLYQELARVSYPNSKVIEAGLENFHGDRPRRHGGHGPDTPHNTSDEDIRRDWGCLHIIYPGTIASTPSFADLDGDGRMEMVYFVPYSAHLVSSLPEIPFKLNVGADMMFMRVVTLEDAFQEHIAPKLDAKTSVDFTTFLPYGRQPWTKYMGRCGDSHYRDSNQMRCEH